MQVDPIKPVFTTPGSVLLKLIYDEPPSTFAFKCNLRRYNKASPDHETRDGRTALIHAAMMGQDDAITARRCRLSVS